jgi:hypothetical protein
MTPGTDVNMKRIFLHPRYDNKSAYFDVAVVETESLTFSDLIRPIWLKSNKTYLYS